MTQLRRSRTPGLKARRGPTLREASFADFEQIAALATRHGLARPRSQEAWRHLWLANPHYRERGGNWTIGWVLEDDAGRIVASIENIPLAYEFQGARVLAASGRSWVADEEYRSGSLLLLEHVISQPTIDLYVNSTFSVASMPAITVFGCSRVPVGVWDESAFWVTDHPAFVKSVLKRQGNRLASALSYPLSAALLLRERFTNTAVSPRGVEVRACANFDERFDDFWVELRRRHPHLLLAVRTREVMAWHFKYALADNRAWIATVVEGGRLIAYAVFDRRYRRDIGLYRVRLVDFQALDGSTDLLPPIISWALGKCRAEGIHMLESVGRWLEPGELLDVIAPYRRKLSGTAWLHAYRANNALLADQLRDRRAWAPSLFDGDASLM
jgi:hypothetical protein